MAGLAHTSEPHAKLERIKVPNFEYKPGQIFNVSLFKEGDYVTVSGKSKGRGFSGTVKKYSFSNFRKRRLRIYWNQSKQAVFM